MMEIQRMQLSFTVTMAALAQGQSPAVEINCLSHLSRIMRITILGSCLLILVKRHQTVVLIRNISVVTCTQHFCASGK